MSRLEKIYGVGLALIIITGLAIGLWVWQQRQLQARLDVLGRISESESFDSRTKSHLGLSVKAFGQAHAIAVATWQDDALLVSGLNSWVNIIHPSDLETMPDDGWQYTFYSPETQTAASFTVSDDEQVSRGQPFPADRPLNPRPANEWRINDAQAMRIFLENGGEDFFNSEETIYMTMQLSTVAEENRVEWLIAAVAEETGHSITIWIDAGSGDIIDTLLVQ